jgi:hypothetical protein
MRHLEAIQEYILQTAVFRACELIPNGLFDNCKTSGLTSLCSGQKTRIVHSLFIHPADSGVPCTRRSSCWSRGPR